MHKCVLIPLFPPSLFWRKQFFKIFFLLSLHLQVCTPDDACRFSKVSELFVYEKFFRVPVESVEAGDICAVCGIDDIQVELCFFN